MGEKLVVGPVTHGLTTNTEPFNIDNDSFPTLIDAYQWRDRIKRKRGTETLGRLQRFIGKTDGSGNATITIFPQPIPTGLSAFQIGTDFFFDIGDVGPLTTLVTNSVGTGTLNRSTGVLTITGAVNNKNTNIIYFPGQPVLGLEDLTLNTKSFPGTIAFDQTYSYNITTTIPATIYDVSFYKNPPNGSYNNGSYVAKGTWTPVWWNAKDYQQFWTVNYQGALWATKGIQILSNLFSIANIGMQFAGGSSPQTIVYVSNTATTLTVQIVNTPLVVGDFVFVNEWTAASPADALTLNLQSGYVTSITLNTPVMGTTQVVITFPDATIAVTVYTPGIIQYLTNSSDTTKDCIRWYDGDPTDGVHFTPSSADGWVNFMPPLSQLSYVYNELPLAQYYLVGAVQILPFKDRLLFFGPIVQTSSGTPIYLQDTVIYSQNGTPYYTASFTGDPTLANTQFIAILTPATATGSEFFGASPGAFWADQTGFGGFAAVGIDRPIKYAAPNEDVLIVGLDSLQTRLVYTGDDIFPFVFYLVNSELGTSSTFSQIIMDQGIFTKGNRGIILTTQVGATRIDTDILPQVFTFNLQNNGNERITAQRDYINEWIYLTYLSNDNSSIYIFPNQTLQFNYRDNTWAVFNECYTTYGQFKPQSGYTWLTTGYNSWQEWTDPWVYGDDTLLQPQVIAGNQQGYILLRADGTNEAPSLSIQNISTVTLTVPNHCLNSGDYFIIEGALLNTGSSITQAPINGKVYSVSVVTDNNNFMTNPPLPTFTYAGSGTITRMYVPFIQTKQFPMAWSMARKTRIGPQQYLIKKTDQGQITLQIYLSQNADFPYNDPQYVINNALVYTTKLYTCPESANLGLTPFNSNLAMLSDMNTGANQQTQIWHRVNTSLIGDTVQLGFTISDAQMRQYLQQPITYTITGATQANPCVLTVNNNLGPGTLIQISNIGLNVVSMTQLNLESANSYTINATTYLIIAASSTTLTINVDSTSFTAFAPGDTGTINLIELPNQFEEVEIHGFILDIQPSMVLA